MFEQRFIVQDLESHEFLYPDAQGDIGQTPFIKHAGQYNTFEDACNAGTEEIGDMFTVFSFYERKQKE